MKGKSIGISDDKKSRRVSNNKIYKSRAKPVLFSPFNLNLSKY